MKLIYIYLIISVLLLAVPSLIMAQDRIPFRWRISNAAWNSTSGAIFKYDKLEHGLGSAGLFVANFILANHLKVEYPAVCAFSATLLAGFAWEMKDAIFPWEKYGFWGGDGFDTLDFLADFIGVFLTYVVTNFILPN